jgi:hypothetical protein
VRLSPYALGGRILPVTYVCDREAGIIRTRCAGNVIFEEVIGHFRELESDPSIPARLDVLLDLSDMQSIPDRTKLRMVAGEISGLQKKVKWGAWAIVASSDALYGMIRVFEVFAEENFERSGVFRKLDEAEQWLTSVRSSGKTR